MRAAGLHPIETILSSQAVLIQSSKPKDPANAPLIKMITSRIAGVLAASKYILCTYNIKRDLVSEATKITPGRRAATITTLEEDGWVAVNAMLLKSESADIMDRLVALGAQDVFTTGLENCRV